MERDLIYFDGEAKPVVEGNEYETYDSTSYSLFSLERLNNTLFNSAYIVFSITSSLADAELAGLKTFYGGNIHQLIVVMNGKTLEVVSIGEITASSSSVVKINRSYGSYKIQLDADL